MKEDYCNYNNLDLKNNCNYHFKIKRVKVDDSDTFEPVFET